MCARAERELFNWGHLRCWEGGEGEEGVRGARRRRATASKRAREWAAEQKRERERASDIQGRIPTAAALKPLQRAKAIVASYPSFPDAFAIAVAAGEERYLLENALEAAAFSGQARGLGC